LQNFLDLESGLPDYRSGTSRSPQMMPAYEILANEYGTRGLYHPTPLPLRAAPSRSQWKMDRRLKLTAYVSVVILAALILIIVVIILTMFFQGSIL
jgi:hypothetical protein